MLACRATKGCTGVMQSSFYRVSQTLTPSFEWYQPGEAEMLTLPDSVCEHVRQGGLIIRPIKQEATVKCDKLGCGQEAKWRPVLVLPAPLPHVGPPAKAELGLNLCDEHKNGLTTSDLITEESWQQLVSAFKQLGKAIPDRERISIEFVDIRPKNISPN